MTQEEEQGKKEEPLLIAELQLILAEKRTVFALARTGLAIFTVPITIVGFLIVLQTFHPLFDTAWIALTVVGGLIFISAIGLSVLYQTQRKNKKLDGFIAKIKIRNKRISEIVI